jgi:hypothetical protein
MGHRRGQGAVAAISREALDALIQLAAYRHSTPGDQKAALDEILILPDERRSRWRRTGIRTCMGLFLSSSHFGLFGSSLFGAGKPFFVPSPAIRFAERAEGVKGPKR